jgi:hypothetical protein
VPKSIFAIISKFKGSKMEYSWFGVNRVILTILFLMLGLFFIAYGIEQEYAWQEPIIGIVGYDSNGQPIWGIVGYDWHYSYTTVYPYRGIGLLLLTSTAVYFLYSYYKFKKTPKSL